MILWTSSSSPPLSPQEVEAVLTSHPRVASASVFARADATLGEVPYARVVARPSSERLCSEAELLDYCKRRLARFKVPQRIEFVDALPRTASGKVLHRDFNPRAETNRDNPKSGGPCRGLASGKEVSHGLHRAGGQGLHREGVPVR